MTAKKNEKTDPFSAMMAGLNAVAKKKKKSASFGRLADEAAKGRWIDFCDPKTGMPCLALEWLWGARGFQTGRILKIEAEEGVGKSSFLMLMYGAAQKTCSAWCAHFEGELAKAPPDFMASYGCDPRRILSPELVDDDLSIEGCFSAIDSTTFTMRSNQDGMDPDNKYPIIVGVDSVSSFGASKNMGEKDTDNASGIGVHSRFLSGWFRDRWGHLSDRDVFLMVIAQLRSKIDTAPVFGQRQKTNETTTLAARPLNFHASMRLEVSTSKLALKEPPYSQYGDIVTFKTTKNKLSPKGKVLKVPLIWDQGFDMTSATIELLKNLSPITLAGGQQFTIDTRGAGNLGGVKLHIPMLSDEGLHYFPNYLPGDLDKRRTNDEVLYRLYANTELLMALREALRIRGFGFSFETDYMPSEAELEDIAPSEEAVA